MIIVSLFKEEAARMQLCLTSKRIYTVKHFNQGEIMEMKKKRVLAYNLAKQVQPDLLNDVSGGGGGSFINIMSSRKTLHPSGGDFKSLDASLDITVDL